MIQKDNKKIVLLDIWGTLLLENKNQSDINYDRANIIFRETNYKNIEFWKLKLDEEIKEFKKKEIQGFSIVPEIRMENLLKKYCNVSKELIIKILCKFDKIAIEKYKPYLNSKLLNELLRKYSSIILISNTGLTTKNAIIKILEQYKIINNFKDMFFSEDYRVCKPNIMFYKLPLKKYKIAAKDVIMYGDSEYMDLNPCKKLNIDCVIKKWSDLYDEK